MQTVHHRCLFYRTDYASQTNFYKFKIFPAARDSPRFQAATKPFLHVLGVRAGGGGDTQDSSLRSTNIEQVQTRTTGSFLRAWRRSILGVSVMETLLRYLLIGLIKYNCTSHATVSLWKENC
jgi:hypothetical protein